MFKTPKKQKTPKKGLKLTPSNLLKKDKSYANEYLTICK